ncbi:MAG: T9SS type A sorting domain-containing protein, partial [Flavobacteriales bacterium]|nr:T9SS type A sorting domain-containing protein [Flavobacteriales bacterium]
GYGLTSGSELQGLTLGGVGRGTKLSFVDIYASSDDGMETFGGTVDLKYFCVAFAEDDSYDFDEQWTGKAQFLFSIQRADVADSGWEYDGSTPDDTPEFTNATIYNFTHIGAGVGAAASNPIGLNIRAGGAVTAANGIVTEMKGKGIEIQDKTGNTTTDSYSRFLAGLTSIDNNIFYNIGSYTLLDGSDNGVIRVTSGADDATAAAFSTALAATNTYGNPSLVSISRDQDGGLDPRPSMTGIAYTTPLAAYPSDAFFTSVNYKGAISSTANQCYIAKWTTLAKNGHLAGGLDWNGLETSINEYNGVINDLKVFPNPANGIVNIYYNSEKPVTVEIFNLQGQVVRSVNGLAAGIRTETIAVSDLAKGLYFVRFTDGVNAFSQKLLVD